MRERPNRTVSKTVEPPGSVGSNPTPSALRAGHGPLRGPSAVPDAHLRFRSCHYLLTLKGAAVHGHPEPHAPAGAAEVRLGAGGRRAAGVHLGSRLGARG